MAVGVVGGVAGELNRGPTLMSGSHLILAVAEGHRCQVKEKGRPNKGTAGSRLVVG